MTGSPTSNYPDLGGTPTGEDCDGIFDRTTLNSPNPSVLPTIKPDDVLTLTLQQPRGPLVATTAGGQIAGSITSASLARIIGCIQRGHQFVALVLSVRGGACEVEVRPRSR